jgi:hypothetical protein
MRSYDSSGGTPRRNSIGFADSPAGVPIIPSAGVELRGNDGAT